MKKKNEKVLSLVLCIAVMLSSIFALNFSFSALADENSSDDGTTQPTTINNTLPSTAVTTTKPTVPPTTKPAVKPVAVGNLTNLKVTKITPTYISVKWNKTKNATNYKVEYKKVGKNYKWVYVKTIKDTTVSVAKLSANNLYYIRVTPVAIQNSKTYTGKSNMVKSSTATSVVTGVKITNYSNPVTVKWNRNKYVTGYKVYRASAVSNNKYVLVNTIKRNDTPFYYDYDVSNKKIYYYKIKAYRTYPAYGTVVSNYSSPVMGTCGLYATTLKTSSELGKITVSWTPVPAASGFRLYQSAYPNKGFKCIANTTKRSFTTNKLTGNKTYYFKVQPYKKHNGKEIKPSVAPKVKSQKATNTIWGRDVGNTYIEINIKEQHMWFYVNGKLYVDTPVVTGMADGVHDTPKGVHSIFVHQSPSRLVGDTWDVMVQYWMQFTSDGCGIHDSTWRANSEYGGDTYKTNGSHGCVNTPLDKVAKIYKKATYGTIVVVH